MLKILTTQIKSNTEIFISTLSEELDGAIKLPKLPIIPIVKQISSVINATKHNIATYVGEALT